MVNFNGRRWLPECLASLAAQTHPHVEIVIVDNASTDGSVEWLASSHPRVRSIANSGNVGYAAACNQGAGLARGRYIAFLNPDTVAEPRWLERTVALLRAHPRIGACMPKLLIHDSGRLNSSGGKQHYLGVAWSGDCYQADRVPDGARDVAFASGAAMVVGREAWDRARGFDSAFHMYCEDVDLSWRLRLLGYRVVMLPSAVVRHRYDFSRNKEKFYLIERNRLSMLVTNYGTSALLVLLPGALLFEVAMLTYATLSGWPGAKLKSYRELWRRRGELMAKRRRVQSGRLAADRDVAALFVGAIAFSPVDGAAVRFANVFLRSYWRLAYRLLG